MRLTKIHIKNYRSVSNSGPIHISSMDNVTVLAGQNESGKSSILRALLDFENGKFSEDSTPFTVEDKKFQHISCTYNTSANEQFFSQLNEYIIEDKGIKDVKETAVLDEAVIRRIKQFTLTRKAVDDKASLEIDNTAFQIFKASIRTKPLSSDATQDPAAVPVEASTPQKYFELEEQDRSLVARIFMRAAPLIVFFDDFCDLLPDKILISSLREKKDKTKGYRAVRNLEKILGTDFEKKDSERDAVRRTRESGENKDL